MSESIRYPGSMIDAKDKIFATLFEARAVTHLLTAAYSEYSEHERPSDEVLCGCLKHISLLLMRVIDTSDNAHELLGVGVFDGCTPGTDEDIQAARCIAYTLDRMAEADVLDIKHSDDMMCSLTNAMRECIDRALARISPRDEPDMARIFAFEGGAPAPRGSALEVSKASPVSAPAITRPASKSKQAVTS